MLVDAVDVVLVDVVLVDVVPVDIEAKSASIFVLLMILIVTISYLLNS